MRAPRAHLTSEDSTRRLGLRQEVEAAGAAVDVDRWPVARSSERETAVPDRFLSATVGFSEAWRAVSNGAWNPTRLAGIIKVPGETESGSAGTQPGKGYPGRRCTNGASGPRLGDWPGAVVFPSGNGRCFPRSRTGFCSRFRSGS